MEEKRICEIYDEQGNKKQIEILTIFKIEGYEERYALGTSKEDKDNNIYAYKVNEQLDDLVLENIKDEKISNIIKEMIDTLLR